MSKIIKCPVIETVRPCGCKGVRTCLRCETVYGLSNPDYYTKFKKHPSYVYCPLCKNKAWPGWNVDLYMQHPNHEGIPVEFPGVSIQLDFLNNDESALLLKNVDSLPWEDSQSGRRKQNYGPKVNFKKKRLALGKFLGFPETTKFVQDRFATLSELQEFQTIEQCSLEYDPELGASIDPHIDDCWVWGERIVTVNILGDSVLTMIPYRGPSTRYNLNCCEDLDTYSIPEEDITVRLPMPVNSIVILSKSARYCWEHCILRNDVNTRRVCIAYREFTEPYYISGNKADSSENEASKVFCSARHFW